MPTPRHRCLLILLLGWALLAAGGWTVAAERSAATQVQAPRSLDDDRIIERGVLVDPDGTLGIEDIATRAFTPFAGTFSGGFTRAVHWFRFVVGSDGNDTELALRIRPSVLDDLRLYEAQEGPPGTWPVRTTGDRHPFEARDRPSAALGFVVRPGAAETVYYLRLQTTSTSTLNIEALPIRQANRKDHALDTMHLVFAGLMLWPLIWALLNYLVDRDRVVGIFAFHQSVYILYGLSVTGYLADLGPPGIVDPLTSVVVCLVLFSGSLFARALLRGGEPPRALSIGLDLLLAVFPLQMIVMLAGRTEIALGINAALIVVSRWYFVLVAAFLRKDGMPSRRFLLLAMLILAMLVTAILPANFGWALFPDLNLRDAIALVVFGLVSTSLFVALLNARLAEARLQARRNEVELILTRRALELEQALKLRAEAEANTDELTRLCNRRHFLELGEREIARAVRYGHPLTLLMLDLDHFKRVNDTWGHDAGDQVLRSVSEVLRGSLRDVDILARIGGEEFAILLVEAPEPQAMQVAQRIRSAVENTPITLAGGATVTITLSIGVAVLGARSDDLRNLLREADRALYSAKQQGRNRVAGVPGKLP